MTRHSQFVRDFENCPPKPAPVSENGQRACEPESPREPKDVLRFISELAQQGDVAGYDTVCGRVFLVNHPALIHRVFQSERYERSLLISMALGKGLLTTEGEAWLRRRRLLQPAFRQQQLASFAPLILRTTTEMLDRWDTAARAGETINVADEMIGLTLRIIVKALFSVDIGNEPSDLPAAFSVIIAYLSRCGYVQFNIPQQISPTDQMRYQQAIDRVDDFVYGIIRRRASDSARPDDLLSVLLKAYGPPGTDSRDGLCKHLRDEMLTLILAGHETSATAISWTWHLLSQHPLAE